MRRRKCRRCGRCDWPMVFGVAFGLGLFLALFCSVRFALLVAAVALVCIGIAYRP